MNAPRICASPQCEQSLEGRHANARYCSSTCRSVGYWAQVREQVTEKRRGQRDEKRAYDRDYRAANRERIAAAGKAYREANRERIAAWRAENCEQRRASSAAYKAKNPELVRARSVAHYQANRERRIAASIEWRKQNPERSAALDAAWGKANPERVRAIRAARRARVRNAPGDGLRAADWSTLLEWAGNACMYCGSPENLSIEHVVALISGGAHDITNIVPACFPCNARKGRKAVAEWAPNWTPPWWITSVSGPQPTHLIERAEAQKEMYR